MRIQVTRRFRDMDALTNPDRAGADDPVHEVGATLTVTKERGGELVDRGFAVEIQPASPAAKPPASKGRTKPAGKSAAKKAATPAAPPAPPAVFAGFGDIAPADADLLASRGPEPTDQPNTTPAAAGN